MIFLSHLFESLRKEHIQYSVLRNYQHLPKSTAGSDLDILINKKDSVAFMSLLITISKKYNGNIISIIDSEICPRICILGDEGKGWGVMIDLHYDKIEYRGCTIFSNTNIWKNTFKNNNEISVLNQKADALIGLLKELLNNETCKREYYESFKKFALDREFLDEVFQDINKPKVVNILMKSYGVEYSKVEIKRLSDQLNNEFPRKNFDILEKTGKLKRLFNQPGFSIAFLGTDGSGKSTIIENIKPPLNDAFHRAVYYEHMRPNRFYSIARLLGEKEGFDGIVTNPHGSSSSGFFGSLMRWCYYMGDYTLGFYLKIYPKKAVRSCIWIFDRYYYDYLIDPKRGRINLPKWILKVGQFIIPEPDIILCLGADANTIHHRKPELSLAEVERQVAALQEFCNSHKRAVWIDTGKSVEESSNDALKAVVAMMGKRFESAKLTT